MIDAKYLIENCPASHVYYIPDFICESEEEQLLRNVYSVPLTKWTQLTNRRLQNWGGTPHPTLGMVKERLPQWLESCMQKLTPLKIYGPVNQPNHVLINEYKPNEGIMPHLDGPLYFPAIATINLGSHTVLNFYHVNDSSTVAFSLYLAPRSLLIQQGDIYHTYMHGIDERMEDTITESILNYDACNLVVGECIQRATRISLTIRHVLKTSSIKIKLCR